MLNTEQKKEKKEKHLLCCKCLHYDLASTFTQEDDIAICETCSRLYIAYRNAENILDKIDELQHRNEYYLRNDVFNYIYERAERIIKFSTFERNVDLSDL